MSPEGLARLVTASAPGEGKKRADSRSALVLNPFVPYPETTGGKIRTFRTTRALARRFTVDFLCFLKREEELSGVERLKEFCRTVHTVPFPTRPSQPRWRAILANVSRGLPDFASDVASPAFATALDELLARNRYDLIVFEHTEMAQYRRQVRSGVGTVSRTRGDAWQSRSHGGPRTALVAHNVESMKAMRRLTVSRGLRRRAYLTLDALRSFAYERRMARRFDLLVACSAVDRARLERWYGASRVAVVPNGVDCRQFQFEGAQERDTILLMGTLGYPPNREATVHFLTKILPEARRLGVGNRVEVVGGDPDQELRRLGERDGGVLFPGFVPDVRPYLRRAAVLAVPLLVGGGTRLKILTAMAAGTPVVSTLVGAEGIEAQPGSEILLADEPGRFAELVGLLLSDVARRRAVATAARGRVERDYDWSAIGDGLVVAYERLIQESTWGGGSIRKRSWSAAQCT